MFSCWPWLITPIHGMKIQQVGRHDLLTSGRVIILLINSKLHTHLVRLPALDLPQQFMQLSVTMITAKACKISVVI